MENQRREEPRRRAESVRSVVEVGVHIEAVEKVLQGGMRASVTGQQMHGDANLVDAHDLDDPGLEVEDLLVPDAHPRLVDGRPVHDVRPERLVDLLHDPVRECLKVQGGGAGGEL